MGWDVWTGLRRRTTPEAIAPDVDVDAEAAAILGAADLFRSLGPEQRRLVGGLGQVREHAAGDILAVAGNLGDTLYVIAQGQVELLAPSSVGHLRVRTAGAGDTLPLASLVSDGRLITSAVAISNGRTLAIPCLGFMALCDSHPDIGLPVYRAVAEILGGRYRSVLGRVCDSADRGLLHAEAWANV